MIGLETLVGGGGTLTVGVQYFAMTDGTFTKRKYQRDFFEANQSFAFSSDEIVARRGSDWGFGVPGANA